MEEGGSFCQTALVERWIGYRAGFALGVTVGATVVGFMAGIVVLAFRHCIFG